MVPDQLTQKRALNTLRFQLLADAVLINERRFLSWRKHKVPYTVIAANAMEVFYYSRYAFWSAVTLLSLALILAALDLAGLRVGPLVIVGPVLLAVPCILRFWLSRAAYLVYRGRETSVVFYRDLPTSEEFVRFLVALEKRKLLYILSSIAAVPNLTLAELRFRVRTLVQAGTLTQEQADDIMREISRSVKLSMAVPPSLN